MERVLNSVKGYTSTRMTQQAVKRGRIWQAESFDRLVRDRTELRAWRRYIAENPGHASLDASHFILHHAHWLDEAEREE